jgi:TldD protein
VQARKTLLTPYGLDVADLTRVFGKIMTHQVDYADLYFQYSRSEAWSLEEGIVKSGSFSIDEGVGVRALAGEKTAFAYSDDISAQALGDAASGGAGHCRCRAGAARAGAEEAQRSEQLYVPHDPLASLDAAAKVQTARTARTYAAPKTRASPGHGASSPANTRWCWWPAATAAWRPTSGRWCGCRSPSSSKAMAASANRVRRAAAGAPTTAFSPTPCCAAMRQEAVHQAVTNLVARPAPAGTMTVVLGSGWPGILLHEAVGHGLEGDFNRKGSSTFAGRVGSRVAAKGVTVIDDGTIAERRGSLNIDDEGNPTQRTVLIEDGILKGYMQDSLNARLMGVRQPATAGASRSPTCRCRA